MLGVILMNLVVLGCLLMVVAAVRAAEPTYDAPMPVVTVMIGDEVIGVGTTEHAARTRFTLTEKTQLPLIYIQNTCGRRRRVVPGSKSISTIEVNTSSLWLAEGATVRSENIGISEQEDVDIGFEWLLGDGQCNSADQLSSSKRFGVYVRAAHHWERNVNFRLWRNAREVEPSHLSTGDPILFVENSSKIVNEVAVREESVVGTPAPTPVGQTLPPGATMAPIPTNKKTAAKSYSALEPRIEMTKGCSEFLDECFMTKYFTYTKSWKYSGDVEEYDDAHHESEAMFYHRLACRVDDAEWGRWNLRVANNLPHDAESEIEVIIVFTDNTWSEYLVAPLVLLTTFIGCGVCAGLLMTIKMIGLQRQQRRVELVQSQQHRDLRRRHREVNGATSSSPASTAPPTPERMSHQSQEEPTSDRSENTIRAQPPSPMAAPSIDEEQDLNSTSVIVSPPEPQVDLQVSSGVPRPQRTSLAGTAMKAVAGGATYLNARIKKLTSRRRELLPTEDGSVHDRVDDSAVSTASSEEGDVCRICRMSDPVESLFSPCRCAGYSKFVHRECLAEWRAMTSNPEHRRVCAECKTPYRLVRKQNMSSALIGRGLTGFAQSAGKFALTLGSLFLGGYILKGWFFLVTIDTQIDWSCFTIYHVVLGFLLLVAMLSYYNVMSPFVETYSTRVQFILVLTAVLITVPLFGYLGHYVLYLTSHVVWSYEICFGSGIVAAYVCYSNIIELLINRMESNSSETEEVADNLDVIFPGQRVRSHNSDEEEMEVVGPYDAETPTE